MGKASLCVTLFFRRELREKAVHNEANGERRVPALLVVLHLLILAGVVFTNHHPEAFMGLFLLFLGLAEAYRRHHDRLLLREGLMVAFFLAGLVVLGGQQQWWLQEVLSRLDETALFYGATAPPRRAPPRRPNFTEVLEDVRKHLALCIDSDDSIELPPPPGRASSPSG